MKRIAAMLALSLVAGTAGAEEPVKLGLLLDMSGVYADVTGPGSELAARMAVEDYGGKVLGRPIQVMVSDHLNKPDIASAKAREWFDTEHIDAILDVAATAPALAVMGVAKERNKLVIMSGPGSSAITGASCIPTGIHWAYDTYALAHATGTAVTKQGGDSWFFVAADYSFGAQLEKDTTDVVTALGGKVVGNVKVPLGSPDFSSFLLQAQASKAKVVAFANSGGDLTNSIKQAREFGLAAGGQQLAGLLVYINDVNALGLEATQGMVFTSAFYWDMNDETRAFSKRFFDKLKRMPNMSQAGVYSSVLHYLKAVAKAGTTDTDPVLAAMKAMPVDDVFTKHGHIREDGLMEHDMYLFQVKTPAESKAPWDYYKLVATIPGSEAFAPLAESKCPLLKK